MKVTGTIKIVTDKYSLGGRRELPFTFEIMDLGKEYTAKNWQVYNIGSTLTVNGHTLTDGGHNFIHSDNFSKMFNTAYVNIDTLELDKWEQDLFNAQVGNYLKNCENIDTVLEEYGCESINELDHINYYYEYSWDLVESLNSMDMYGFKEFLNDSWDFSNQSIPVLYPNGLMDIFLLLFLEDQWE